MKNGIRIVAGLLLLVIPLLIPVGEGHDRAAAAEKWVARYNGPGNGDDSASAIAVDGSGNIYVTGTSKGAGADNDFATVKYDSNGKQLWAKSYDGPGRGDDKATGIAVDGSGYVYVLGESKGSGTGSDITTIKYSANGKQLWVKRYNGPANRDDVAGGLAVDGSGNVYVAGANMDSSVGPYFKTIKYSSKGSMLWAKAYSDPTKRFGCSFGIALDGSGNAHAAGWVKVGAHNDFGAVKYDASGNQLWAKRYSGAGDFNDCAQAIAVDSSGNVYIAGYSSVSGFKKDWATLKYGPAGNQLWVKRYDGPLKGNDCPEAIAADGSGNTYVTGWSEGLNTGIDYTTIKYNPNGKQLWAKRYNAYGNCSDAAKALVVDGSGNVYITGYSGSQDAGTDFATIMYNPAGKQLCVIRYNGPGNLDDRAKAIAIDKSGNIYVAGESTGSGTGYDFATIKY